MPIKELKVEDLTQEELDYILKKRQRESRARMKSESALKDYLKTLPTINAFLKKTGLLGKTQTRNTHKGLYALEHRVLNDPRSPIVLTQHYARKISDFELDVSTIEIVTRSLCGIRFQRDLKIKIQTYKNKVFYIAIFEQFNSSYYIAEKYERDPILSFGESFYITPDFKTQILNHIYHVYQTSILSTEFSAKVAQEAYEGYQKQVQKLKKIFGKNYNKYKNMFPALVKERR